MMYYSEESMPQNIKDAFGKKEGFFLPEAECTDESTVDIFKDRVYSGIESTEVYVRTLTREYLRKVIGQAVAAILSPREAGFAYLSLRLVADGGAVPNNYGYAAMADHAYVHAIPGTGILARAWRGYVPNGRPAQTRAEWIHPVLGARTSEKRFLEPLGFKTERGARQATARRTATLGSGLIRLPDGSFAGFVENKERLIIGPDWEASTLAVEAIGGVIC